MDNTFKCGLVKIATGGKDPSWTEFAKRMAFAQRLGLNAVFLASFENGKGDWVVPFFSAEDSMGRYARVSDVITSMTPTSS